MNLKEILDRLADNLGLLIFVLPWLGSLLRRLLTRNSQKTEGTAEAGAEPKPRTAAERFARAKARALADAKIRTRAKARAEARALRKQRELAIAHFEELERSGAPTAEALLSPDFNPEDEVPEEEVKVATLVAAASQSGESPDEATRLSPRRHVFGLGQFRQAVMLETALKPRRR